jgi:hypothetical protein
MSTNNLPDVEEMNEFTSAADAYLEKCEELGEFIAKECAAKLPDRLPDTEDMHKFIEAADAYMSKAEDLRESYARRRLGAGCDCQ